jgi:hypothetical protein
MINQEISCRYPHWHQGTPLDNCPSLATSEVDHQVIAKALSLASQNPSAVSLGIACVADMSCHYSAYYYCMGCNHTPPSCILHPPEKSLPTKTLNLYHPSCSCCDPVDQSGGQRGYSFAQRFKVGDLTEVGIYSPVVLNAAILLCHLH